MNYMGSGFPFAPIQTEMKFFSRYIPKSFLNKFQMNYWYFSIYGPWTVRDGLRSHNHPAAARSELVQDFDFNSIHSDSEFPKN